MIVECLKCHTRYRVNELLFREAPREVRCSRCRHVFVVNRVMKIGCSVCGVETSHPGDFTIRTYRGAPYALCPVCAESLRGLLDDEDWTEEGAGEGGSSR